MVDDLTTALRMEGAEVTLLSPAQFTVDAPLPDADVVVLKDKTPSGLALGKRFHLKGVPTVSPYPATELCRDKFATNRVLTEAGIPVPPCYVVRDRDELLSLLEQGPVILKPIRGSKGRGIAVVESANEVPNIEYGEVFVQRYFKPDGLDLKVYRIGSECFCVERTWPPKTLEEKLGHLLELDDDVIRVVQACGDAVGSEVYGVDVIRHDGVPWVVDMSSFPGFKGVPDAGSRLAQVVIQAGARGRSRPR